MQWICSIAMFLVLSGIVLELIADTKYYKFARWVTGVILLMQFLKPMAENEFTVNRFDTIFDSFDYALGTDRVVEEIYETDERTEQTVLTEYKAQIGVQIDRILQKNGLELVQTELSVANDGTVEKMQVWAAYLDGKEAEAVLVPTVVPVRIGEERKENTVSPLELYIRELLAEFFRIEENNIEVIIQEAG